MKTLLRVICLLLCGILLAAQPAWDLWKRGDITGARKLAESTPADPGARHLRVLALYVQGEYGAALDEYSKLPSDYARLGELRSTVAEAYVHLGRLGEAAAFARKAKMPEPHCAWLEERAKRPLKVELAGTVVAPFSEKNPLKPYLPAVDVEIDGKPYLAHLDTGGSFLAMSDSQAKALGVEVKPVGMGEANARASTISNGIITELRIGEARLTNVPMAALSALEGPQTKNMIILGTNILEQFLVTWDNPGQRLILSPRRSEAARKRHFELAPATRAETAFYLQGDHYLFARGAFGERSVMYFVDSGLVSVDPQGRQAALAVNPAVLKEWNLDAAGKPFLDCPVVSLGPVAQSGLVLRPMLAGKGIPWGGVEVQALLSHGFLKKYAWTLDFDRRRMLFAWQ